MSCFFKPMRGRLAYSMRISFLYGGEIFVNNNRMREFARVERDRKHLHFCHAFRRVGA
jgi:hypothetical protein